MTLGLSPFQPAAWGKEQGEDCVGSVRGPTLLKHLPVLSLFHWLELSHMAIAICRKNWGRVPA